MEKDEALDSKLQPLFRCMDDLGRSNDRWWNLILSGELDPDNHDDEQRLKTHIDDSSLAIQLLESEATSLASFPGADSSQIQSKMDDLREKHADMCQLLSRRIEWFRLLSLIKDEEKWISEKETWLVGDLNSDFDSIGEYEERCKKLAEIGAELTAHKNNINGIVQKLSTFHGRVTETLKERVVLMSRKLVKLRKSLAKNTKDMINNLKCLEFILKAFHIRHMIAEKERIDLDQVSAPDLASYQNLLKEQRQFNLGLRALVAHLATLDQMKDEIVREENIYSDLIVETLARLGSQMETLVARSDDRISRIQPMIENLQKVEERIIDKCGVLAQQFLGGLQEQESGGKDRTKFEELVKSGETEIMSLESLIDELEACSGQPYPRYRDLVNKLKGALDGNKLVLNQMKENQQFINELSDNACVISDWINRARSALLNSENKQEQLQVVDKVLAEMDLAELEQKLKLLQEVDARLEKRVQIADENDQVRQIVKEVVQGWDGLKELTSRIKEKLKDDCHPEELSDVQAGPEEHVPMNSDPTSVAEQVRELSLNSVESSKNGNPE